MRVWRICKQRHLASAWSGIGAETSGGRWNHRGIRMVYTSTSLSLAALELFVHLEPSVAPDDLHWVSATLEEVSVERITTADLPSNWRQYPAPGALQNLGSRWIQEARTLALVVPSAVNPEEQNVLLNPLHAEAGAIHPVDSMPFQFDPRMWR